MAETTAAAQGPGWSSLPVVLHGASPEVERLRARVREAGRSDRHLVISGRPGSGRAAVARAVHVSSRRATAPLVTVRGAETPDEVLAREIFGYLRAAVPGATAARAGYVHSAAGGALLLEGLPALGGSVLDAVIDAAASGRARMLGSTEGQPFDLRLMLSSDLDASSMVVAPEPWASLPSRLPWQWIAVPPLTERSGDVPCLLHELLAVHADRLGRVAPRLSEDAEQAVTSHPWPGNLAELTAVVLTLLSRCTGPVIGARDLPPEVRRAGHGDGRTLAQLEADHVRRVVDACGGNRSEAARRLGIDRKTLRAKLVKAVPADAP